MWRSPGEAQERWAGRRVQKFRSRPGPDKKKRVKFHLLLDKIGLTSNPRFSSSSCTAQFASRSNPLMLKEPNLIWVGGGAGGFVFWRGLAWRRFLWCLMDFCLCLEGQKVSLSNSFVVWILCLALPCMKARDGLGIVACLSRNCLPCYSAAGLSFCREVGDLFVLGRGFVSMLHCGVLQPRWYNFTTCWKLTFGTGS